MRKKKLRSNKKKKKGSNKSGEMRTETRGRLCLQLSITLPEVIPRKMKMQLAKSQ
jgi:hypothetical protein